MKVVILGDLHLISPDDANEARRQGRHHFAAAWPSFKAMAACIRDEAPDLVVSLGDVVDYFSPENRDFAMGWLDALKVRWLMTPGNHDLEWPDAPASAVAAVAAGPEGEGEAGPAEEDAEVLSQRRRAAARQGWAEAGVELGNRSLDADGVQLLLMDTATSEVPEATRAWLEEVLAAAHAGPRLLLTHVPVNHPRVVEHILSVDPNRNLEKYVQRTPLYEGHLRGRVEAVFTGHLHFPGRVEVGGTAMHMLPLSVTAVDREYRGQGAATVLEIERGGWRMRELRMQPPSFAVPQKGER